MLRPSTTLVVLTAAVAVPLCTAAAFHSIFLAALPLFVALAAFDALRATHAQNGWQVSLPPTQRWFQNRAAPLILNVTHPGAHPQVVRIALALPPEITTPEEILIIEIAGRGIVTISCKPLHRGSFTLSVCYLEASSQWRLWKTAHAIPVHCEIRVYPDLRQPTSANLLVARSSLGLHHQRQLGKGREFEKLREYTHGDSFEDIHWKATARRGHPVVKVFQIEQTQEVYVIVDASRLSARAGMLDRYVQAALRLAVIAESQRDRFGLAVFSAAIDRFVPAGRGQHHFAACRDAIYSVQPRAVTPDLEEILSFLHVRLRKRALLIFLTALDDPSLAEAFVRAIPVLSRRHLIFVDVPDQNGARPLFSGPPPNRLDDVYERLAGHISWTKLRELQRTLDRSGVRMALVNPEVLSGLLARQYLDVKQRQLL